MLNYKVSSVLTSYLTLCSIWYQLYNLKKVKNIHRGLLFLVILQAEDCKLTKVDTLLPVFFKFFKLKKWYQIAQSRWFMVDGNHRSHMTFIKILKKQILDICLNLAQS